MDKYALRLSKEPNLEAVAAFCKNIIGTHDFEAFSSSGKSVTSTIRTIYDCSFKKVNNCYEFSVTGNGFLYNMVRILVGTALYVSDGKLSPHDFKTIIDSKNRALAGKTAPAHGLYLNKVFYKEEELNNG